MISKGFYLYKLVMIDLSKQDRKYVWVGYLILFKNQLTDKPKDSNDWVLKVSLKD